MLLVKKYGGSSVSTAEKILGIAKHLKHLAGQGHKLIVIVSAMGDTTDELVSLSKKITEAPVQREMDMLLSSGERISMALMSMALNELGCPAISFTGSQSGVFTDGSHNNARIHSIKAIRVKEELEKNRVVIIAGFQGVHPNSKEITTLGRGGSDTTAVAMATSFKAKRCDILTDVRGLYSIDPRIPHVTPIPFLHLDYFFTLEMAYWGARVLHYRSVELAERNHVPILVHLSSEEGSGTLIHDMEETEYRSVNFNSSVACLKFDQSFTFKSALYFLKEALTESRLAVPQILHERHSTESTEIFLTTPEENLAGLKRALHTLAEKKNQKTPEIHVHWATVSVTGRGLVNSVAPFELIEVLEKSQIDFDGLITTPLALTVIVPQTQVQRTCQVLHENFVK